MIAFAILSLALAVPVAPATKADVFIKSALHLARYRTAQLDLNGDGRPEVLVYANDAGSCGSGGCDLFVLTPKNRTFRVVMRSSVTRLPIRVLASSTLGWRDLGVMVAGGGILHAYEARMRFDGTRYPGNPTVLPAIPLPATSGTIVLR